MRWKRANFRSMKNTFLCLAQEAQVYPNYRYRSGPYSTVPLSEIQKPVSIKSSNSSRTRQHALHQISPTFRNCTLVKMSELYSVSNQTSGKWLNLRKRANDLLIIGTHPCTECAAGHPDKMKPIDLFSSILFSKTNFKIFRNFAICEIDTVLE